jgi:hypothetical protein
LSCCGKYIGIDEATPSGVIVTGLEVIEPGFLDYVVAIKSILILAPAADLYRWGMSLK